MHWRRKWQPTPVFLPGESQGWGSLVGCHLWGHRVGYDWSDLAAAAATSLSTANCKEELTNWIQRSRCHSQPHVDPWSLYFVSAWKDFTPGRWPTYTLHYSLWLTSCSLCLDYQEIRKTALVGFARIHVQLAGIHISHDFLASFIFLRQSEEDRKAKAEIKLLWTIFLQTPTSLLIRVYVFSTLRLTDMFKIKKKPPQ